jgi:serine/threonine-protein kinase
MLGRTPTPGGIVGSEPSDTRLETLQASVADKYEVLRELGRGGMATVYLARDLAHDRLIALKLLRAELSGADAADRFLREIRILAKLQHPNILSLYDSGIIEVRGDPRLPYFTMPYVEGESLRERLKGDHRPTTTEAVRIVREIADALAAAHAAGVVHRDLKPENVLLSQGHAMVSDFGIAKAMSSSGHTSNVTGTGFVLGTPAYMAPEQALGDPATDHRADLYSLGLIAYELFSGAQPFGGLTPQQMLVAHATVLPEPIGKRAPTLDTAIGKLVMRLLAKRPADRPATAMEVVAELDTITAGGRARRPTVRRVSQVVAALAALVVLGAYAGSFITRSRAQRASHDGSVADSTAGPSVAVLPFDNLSGDKQQEYFSDGISDQITYVLSKVAGLRVSPRAPAFKFRGRGAELHEIGDKLRVTHVIEGSTLQAGNRLRVNVQLINIASGNADWSEVYERTMSDVFQVQDDIARAIVGALGARLTAGGPTVVAGAGTRSLEAFNLYLKGRYHYERRTEPDLLEAETLFKQAIAKDSLYARAYAGLSDTYALLGASGVTTRADAAQPARDAAATAVRLDSTSAEAYTSLGFVRLYYNWDWPGAKQALERAIALNPRYAPARYWHTFSFVAARQLDSALGEARRATAIDASVFSGIAVGWMLQAAGHHKEAVAEFQKVLALDSTNVPAQSRIAPSLVALGRCDEALHAITFLQDVRYRFNGISIGYVLASCNRQPEARAVAADLERRASELPTAAEELVAVYAGLGEMDKAFKWLERAYADSSGPLYKLRIEATFASLRSDPRFKAIAKKMGLP